MDENGYPETEEIELLKKQLNDMDFSKGARAIKELIDETGFGRATLTDNRLEIATGGWSGCEEIISEIEGTMWWIVHWESSHRGGLEVFANTLARG